MKKLITKLRLVYETITGKIAFLPSLLAFLYLCLAFITLYFESLGATDIIKENAPALVIKDIDTARILLSTFIGGIISLMVFSFSMVMILLNQASTNYSPRILPGLISNKRHQIVLGFYIGALIYTILILLSINPDKGDSQIPSFSVLMCILLAMAVLASFIYFIHTISEAIQITRIIEDINNRAKARLLRLIESEDTKEKGSRFPDTEEWEPYGSPETGYLQDISLKDLKDVCDDNDFKIDILEAKGTFILKDFPLFKCDKKLDEATLDRLYSCFGFSLSEVVTRNYILGFKQLKEIALKAMSPGINDPGTAMTCVDYLTELFILRLQKEDAAVYYSEGGDPQIYLCNTSLKELLYSVYAPLREYCKHDVVVMMGILKSLGSILVSEHSNNGHKKLIREQIEMVIQDIESNIENNKDQEALLSVAHTIKAGKKVKLGFVAE